MAIENEYKDDPPSTLSQTDDQPTNEEEEMSRVVEKVYVVSDQCVQSLVQLKEKQKQKNSSLFADDRVFCFGLTFLLAVFVWSFVFYAVSEEYLEIERYRVYVSSSSAQTDPPSFQTGQPPSSPSPSFVDFHHRHPHRQ